MTRVGFELNHDQPLPISTRYRAELFFNDHATGTFPFHVIAPDEAIATKVAEVVLAKGFDEKYRPITPANQFLPYDSVHMVIVGDMGIRSWVQVEWKADNSADKTGTRSLTF